MTFVDILIGFGIGCVFWVTDRIKTNKKAIDEEDKQDDVKEETKNVIQVVNVAEKYKDGMRYLYNLVTTKTNKDKANKFLTQQGFTV